MLFPSSNLGLSKGGGATCIIPKRRMAATGPVGHPMPRETRKPSTHPFVNRAKKKNRATTDRQRAPKQPLKNYSTCQILLLVYVYGIKVHAFGEGEGIHPPTRPDKTKTKKGLLLETNKTYNEKRGYSTIIRHDEIKGWSIRNHPRHEIHAPDGRRTYVRTNARTSE